MSNKFTGRHLEFHILQSFPVSCLNRDDLGSPKSAVIGGVPRARVSSQCWKRAIRLQMRQLDLPLAFRTRMLPQEIEKRCKDLGATDEQSTNCGNLIKTLISDKESSKDALIFISNREIDSIVKALQNQNFEIESKTENESEISDSTKKSSKKSKKEGSDFLSKCCCSSFDLMNGFDIALFGRMVANASDMNVEAAAAVAHAISIHRVDSDIDFFTAVDDCQPDDKSGSAHMGNLEFNSATYYRYISLDLGQLAETMKTDDIAPAVEVFTKALFLAVPSARQATMAAVTPWDYAIVTLRKGQRLQLPFNSPVKTSRENPDLVKAGIAEMKKRFDLYKDLYGSLFGLEFETEFGEGHNGFDVMLAGILNALRA